MLVAIATFLLGRRSLDAADIREGARPSGNPQGAPESDRADDRQRLLTLGILFTIVIFFWIAFYQNGFALTLFADRSTVRSDILKPETYQFFNPFFIVVLTPLLLRFFTLARAREVQSHLRNPACMNSTVHSPTALHLLPPSE